MTNHAAVLVIEPDRNHSGYPGLMTRRQTEKDGERERERERNRASE